jgi:uncharacterized RDD family membrane protein YckC
VAALARRSSSFADMLALAAARGDAAVDAAPRRLLARPSRTAVAEHAGLVSRAGAGIADLVILHAVFLIACAVVGGVLALLGAEPARTLAAELAGAAWLGFAAVYYAGFWSAVGQTPGMRAMRIVVLDERGRPPGLGRALVRFAAALVATAFVLVGFVPVLVDRRARALPDIVARTVVVRAGRPALATSQPGAAASSSSSSSGASIAGASSDP